MDNDCGPKTTKNGQKEKGSQLIRTQHKCRKLKPLNGRELQVLGVDVT